MTTTSDRQTVVTPADNMPGPKQGHWTYDSYATLPDDGQHYEIVDGVLYNMAPAPTIPHQDAAGWFFYYLTVHVRIPGLGHVYMGPTDVEIAFDTVVQPDVFVLLNNNLAKITQARIIGAPDLAIEISSPSTAIHDRHRKYVAYAHAGVKEYWIADPKAHTVELLRLENGAYYSMGVFSGEQVLPTQIVPDFPVQVQQFFV